MRFPTLVFLFLTTALLILPQCSEKTSRDYVSEGIQNTKLGEYAEAMDSFLMAIRKDKKNPKAYVGLGGLYNQKKMYTEAVEVFTTALRLDPAYVDAYYSLGFTYEMMGEMEKAEEKYKKYRFLKKKLDSLINNNRTEKP